MYIGMKARSIALLLLVVFLLVPNSVAFATTDKAFTTARLNKFGSVAIKLGNKFGFDISGFIIPFFNKERQTAVPDFYPGADFKEGISQYTVPQSKLDLGKIINWNASAFPVFLTALYGAILQTDAEHSNHPEKTDCFITTTMEKSSDLPDAPTHFQWGQWLNGVYGIRELLPTDEETGVHDFNRPSLVIAGMNPNEDCKKHEVGFELEKAENDTRQLAAFGAGTETEGVEVTTIMTIVEKIIDGILTLVEEPETEPHKDDVILTMDQKQPWFNFMCNDYWCPGNETGDDSSGTDKTGGWTNFLFSFHQQDKVVAASLQPYKIKILNFPQKPIEKSYDGFNQSEYGMKGAGCSVSPYTPGENIQASLSLGGKVNIIDRCLPPEASPSAGGWNCRTDLPELASSELNAAGQDYADNAIYADACKTENAWELCHNDVIDRARKACVDPLFALTMWLHESAASNYVCGQQFTGGVPVQDFGINVTSIAENFSAQLDRFLLLDYACPHTIQDFFSVYALGLTGGINTYKCYGELNATEKAEVDNYTAAIQGIYTQLGGGSLPSWPKGSCQ
jgi:hypothetical protein